MQWAELQYCSSECWCECWHPWRWCWPRRLLPPYTGHCSVDRAAAAARVKVGDIPQWQLWTLNTHNRGDRYQVRPVGGQTYRDSPLCWSEWHDEGVMQSDSSIQSTISTLTVVGSTWWSLLSSHIKLLRSDLTYLFIWLDLYVDVISYTTVSIWYHICKNHLAFLSLQPYHWVENTYLRRRSDSISNERPPSWWSMLTGIIFPVVNTLQK